MSRGDQPGYRWFFVGFAVLFATFADVSTAQASDTTYFYCRRNQGPVFTDFALAITGQKIALQPHSAPESPGNRIYQGRLVRQYPSGNILVDFNTYSQRQYLGPFFNMLMTPSLFSKAAEGYIRVYNGSNNPAKDTIMYCETKKIFI